MVRPIDITQVVNSLEYLGQSRRRLADIEREEKRRKSSTGAQLGGIAGSLIGSYYGGPAGGAAGGALGSALGARMAGGQATGRQVAQSGYQGYQMGRQQQQDERQRRQEEQQRQQQERQERINQQKQERNRRFNNYYAETIENNSDSTSQQKQFAESIKDSSQDYVTTGRQAQFLGLDPKTLRMRYVNENMNKEIINQGINTIDSQMNKYEKGTQEYNSLEVKRSSLEDLKSKDLGVYSPETIQKRVRTTLPPTTVIETDKKRGLILARTTDPATGQTTTKYLGRAPAQDDRFYKIAYYGEDGKVNFYDTDDLEKAKSFAEKNNGEFISTNKSVILSNMRGESNVRKNREGIEYRVTKDMQDVRNDVIKQLTKKSVHGEEIPPSDKEVDREYRERLKAMYTSTSGVEKNVIQKQYKAVDDKIKEEKIRETTDAFIRDLPNVSTDLKTTKEYIKEIERYGPPENVDKKEALAALRKIRERQEIDKIAEQTKKRESEKSKKIKRKVPQNSSASDYSAYGFIARY